MFDAKLTEGRLIICLISILGCLLLTACSGVKDLEKKWVTQPQIPLADATKTRESKLVEFDSISINGPFNTTVRLIPQNYQLYLHGNSAILDQTVFFVEDRTLHIIANQAFTYLPSVNADLVIIAPVLTRVHHKGSGRLVMNEIHTGSLIVRAEDTSYIELEGRVTRLDAVLSGSSRLNAKCLKARTAMVNTGDTAQAEIVSNNRVGSFASGNSDIYYYDNAQVAGHELRASGSLMRMKGIAEPTAAITLPTPPMLTTHRAEMHSTG